MTHAPRANLKWGSLGDMWALRGDVSPAWLCLLDLSLVLLPAGWAWPCLAERA